jgi:hypothetical protein
LDQKKAIEELTEIYQQNEQEQMALGPSPSEQIQRMLEYTISQQYV